MRSSLFNEHPFGHKALTSQFRPLASTHVGGSNVRPAGPGRLETDDDGHDIERVSSRLKDYASLTWQFQLRQLELLQDELAENIDKEQGRKAHI